ncbi:cbb3-type cytochrome oxidase subunit 3 [Psychromonas antarctica]|uniref:cbb3-type cytochrome oxidase subunit 3 n=1 Tax=Psychromonas antarctica TaxID=67573 RepID=UPI001EE8F621|nr:cbb3-type cytochrome c oxidase subunit 3 [Psychromonas antarctica]MCG6201356.1 cbb3-type cytochrome c oxidase subunit 3 [Psychromonas antarctica]
MDYATFNGLYTLFLIIIFVALILWAYNKKHKKSFEDIGNSIFDEHQDSTTCAREKSEQTGAKK